MRGLLSLSVAGLTLLATLSGPASAQDGEVAAEPPAEAAPAPPKPKPRPKPQAKKPVEKPAEEKAAASERAETPVPDPALAPAPRAVPPTLSTAPPVACEPGQSVQYEAAASPGKGDGTLELWVTRTGTITIDNPLRPLTPDVTRVLQVVIGGKVATVYGPDMLSLRRGAGPAVLEGVIGGAIRWDATLAALSDTLPILSDSGDVLAEFRFRACGTAPAARTLAAPKARRTAPPPEAAVPEGAKEPAKDSVKERSRPTRRAEPRPEGAAPRPAVPLPQGAIP